MIKSLILIVVVSLFCNVMYAQEVKKDYSQLTREEIIDLSYDELLAIPLEDLMKMAEKLGVSIDDLLNMKITVSSKTAMTSRESPGIVSIVTADEIKKSGARDLIDILNMVPGFNFGYDIDGVIGLASRGNWGHEGKILILLDGQEMNENFYSTFQFGNRIPVGQIKRIEIIRGPGSSIYGGYAELGVVNIITKEASDLKGINGGVSSGIMSGNVIRTDYNLSAGQKLNDFEYTVAGYSSVGHRSNKGYENFDSLKYKLGSNDGLIESKNFNMSVNYQGIKTRFIYDKYSTHSFEYPTNPLDVFTSYLGEIRYDWKLSDKLSLTPKINIKNQVPWQMEDTNYTFHKRNYRYTANLTAQYEPVDKIIITGGAEFVGDRAENLSSDTTVFNNGKNTIGYNNFAAFLQCLIKTQIVNVNIGGRFDRHSQFGNNFAPRVGLTKVIDKFHFKLLYSNAFRAPAIMNIEINPGIKPEHTNVTELEAGYQINKSMFITANIFDIQIKNPIVDVIDSLSHDTYPDFKSTGTRGFEIEYRVVKSKMSLNANFSYYSAVNNNVVPYQVPANASYMLAFPKYKATFNSSFSVMENFTIDPSFIFLGPRYGNLLNKNEVAELTRISPKLTTNIFLNYENIFVKRLELGLGVYDLFNVGTEFIQPYGSSFPPLPGYSREILLKLNYKFDL
jgi:outer membrane cobalamin receptor